MRVTTSIVMFLLCAHVSVDVQGAKLDHALFRAIRNRDNGRVAQLLRQGTAVNVRSADGTTPLMTAALHGSRDSVRLLLEYGADTNVANDRGSTALLWAVTDLEKVRLLQSHGANVNACSALGNTPLLVAAALPGGTDVVEHLLAHGADVTVRNGHGISTLVNAVQAGNLEATTALFAHADKSGELDALIGNDATSLLETAASWGTAAIMALLCDRLSAVNGGKLPETNQALNLAMLAQKPEVARILIERGASLNTRRQPGNVPSIVLSTYTEMDDTSVLKALLERGVEVSGRNDHGETALTWARRRGHLEMIKTLLAKETPNPPDEVPEIPQRNVNLHAGNQQALLTGGVAKAILLMERSSDIFLEQRNICDSCHHQNLPSIAMAWARDRGLRVDKAAVDRMVRRQVGRYVGWKTFADLCYEVDRPAPVPPRLFGYGLWGLSALGFPPKEGIEASVWYLAAIQQPNGRWTSDFLRIPMGGADVVSTALSMQALQLYPIAGRENEFHERIENAAQWLQQTAPRYHQERVFQLLGLGWAGRLPEDVSSLVDGLLQRQRSDGGWSQLPNLPSDAWATGQTLVALQLAGGVPTDSRPYQRGLRFLLNTQFDDGSWFVKSRTFAFQPPFESGFPHGRDQWISAGATAWAVMAMTLAVTPVNAKLPESIGDAPSTDSKAIRVQDTKRPAQPRDPYPSQDREVTFARDIRPIITRSCMGCHSGAEPKGGLAMTERSSLLRGGESGMAALVPGLSGESLMFAAASGSHEDLLMPPMEAREKYPALSADEVETVKRWIDAGASWPNDEARNPKTILFIGNSFTYCNDGLDTHVEKLANSTDNGKVVKAFSVTKGGATLKVLYDHPPVRDKIQTGGYDVVVLQGDIPELKEHGVEPFRKYALRLIREIRKMDATPVLFMAWPYQRLDWVTLDEISAAHRDIGDELGIRVAPVGLAFQMAERERPDLRMLSEDEEHESMHGTFLAAQVIYATVFGGIPEDATYRPQEVSPDEAAFLRRIAWKSIEKWNQQGARN